MSVNAFSEKDLAILIYTQKIREKIVTDLMPDNSLPVNDSERKLLVSALDGLDRSVLAQAKIHTLSKANDNQADVNELLSKVLLSTTSRPTPTIRSLKSLEVDYQINDPVPGEKDQGIQALTYGTFFNQE